MSVAVVDHVKSTSKDSVSSLIGIYMGTFGIGRVIGSIIGGEAYERFGGQKMFIGAAIASFVSAAVIEILCMLKRFMSKK